MHYCRSRDFTTRRAPTPPDASYIPDASGPDTLYDTVRRVVQCRTTLERHCTTLYDTVRHCTTLYDTVRHSTTQYDTVRHSTTQYDTVRHSTTRRTVSYGAGTTLYDTIRHCRTVSYDIHMYIYVCMYVYLSGTFITCQLSGFWHFSALSTTFAFVCKHVVTWGGVCVYFLKCVRKRRFRNVWVWGGGLDIFQGSTTQDSGFSVF